MPSFTPKDALELASDRAGKPLTRLLKKMETEQEIYNKFYNALEYRTQKEIAYKEHQEKLIGQFLDWLQNRDRKGTIFSRLWRWLCLSL